MNDILDGLNDAQRSAVASSAKVLQVLAPPGSGKTKTLTARVAYLIARQGLQPWNIIVCTFTVKAAMEMKERINSFVGDDLAKKLKLGTFHSVALRYLKHYGHHIGLAKEFGVADTTDSRAILKRLIKKFGLSIEPGPALGRISARKVKGISPGKNPKNVEQQEFDKLFHEYEAALAASNLLDYDDLLLRCCSLLRDHPQCVEHVQAVLIDEFQDTNSTQYDLMGLFAQRMNEITIVGDPDQSIYGFRMAEIQNLTRMKTRWPDTLTINLEENYRSSGAILRAAQKIIEQDQNRPQKKLQATHSFGLRPVLRKLPSAQAEAEWLVSEIKRIRAITGNMLQLSDVAVLLRSAALSRVIETAFGQAGISYRMVGGTKFYDRLEVKLVVDYLRVIHNPANAEALERTINVPPRRVGDETVKKLREESLQNDISLWELVLQVAQGRRTAQTKLSEPSRKGLAAFVNVILCGQRKMVLWETEPPSLIDLVTLVVQKINLQAFLKMKYAEEQTHEARWSNVEDLMTQATEISSPARLADLLEADNVPDVEGVSKRSSGDQDILSAFLANIALTAATEQKSEQSGEKIQQVTISTIHAAKGLEWPIVFIPACFDGSIPHSRADDHDEERRLLYVGMTRAQAILYLSCPMRSTHREETNLSTFLTQPGINEFVEEFGPSLPYNAVESLSVTLRRTCPSEIVMARSKTHLELLEDNFWPLNGEEPQMRSLNEASHNIATMSVSDPYAKSVNRTIHTTADTERQFGNASLSAKLLPGFTSVSARYEELMEQSHLRKVDKRAEKELAVEAPLKGRKRQMKGQAGISPYFGKKNKTSGDGDLPGRLERRQPMIPTSSAANMPTTYPTSTCHPTKPSSLTHKPRATPILRRPVPDQADEEQENRMPYVFLSSSPPRETNESIQGLSGSNKEKVMEHKVESAMRPASTLHTTSMTHLAGQRRTLGVRRSLHGWNSTKKA